MSDYKIVYQKQTVRGRVFYNEYPLAYDGSRYSANLPIDIILDRLNREVAPSYPELSIEFVENKGD